MDSIQDKISSFADEWQNYCLPDKSEKIKPQINNFIEEIDKLLSENSNIAFIMIIDENKKQKAKLYYLKGRILDLLPVYQKSAE